MFSLTGGCELLANKLCKYGDVISYKVFSTTINTYCVSGSHYYFFITIIISKPSSLLFIIVLLHVLTYHCVCFLVLLVS